MGASLRMTRSTAVGDVIVYAWEDGVETGFVGVRTELRIIFPCDAYGAPTGGMSLRAVDGEVIGEEPGQDKGRFIRVAVPLLMEWARAGALPERVSRTYW